MQFTPKSEQEITDSKVAKAGIYAFEIQDAWEKKSAAGNDMFELKVEVSNGNGMRRTLPDYLLPKGISAEKLLHCSIACGIRAKYDSGLLSHEDFIGKRGRVRLGIEKKKGFPDRNVIEDYLAA